VADDAGFLSKNKKEQAILKEFQKRLLKKPPSANRANE